MIWLIVIAVALFIYGLSKQYLSEKYQRLLIKFFISVLILLVSGLITRFILIRIGTWFTAWSAGGGALAVLLGVIGIILIPVVFALVVLVLVVIVRKISRR